MSQTIRFARGKKPVLHDDPNIDRLMAMVVALSAEVSILRERVDTHERLAARHGVFSRDEVDAYRPDEQGEADRQQLRARHIHKVFRVLAEDAARDTADLDDTAYEDVVRQIEADGASLIHAIKERNEGHE